MLYFLVFASSSGRSNAISTNYRSMVFHGCLENEDLRPKTQKRRPLENEELENEDPRKRRCLENEDLENEDPLENEDLENKDPLENEDLENKDP